MNIKQVIIIRRDLKMRRGKEIAQGSHASMAFLKYKLAGEIPLTQIEKDWLFGLHTKVTLQVDSEAELIELYREAVNRGLTAYMVWDAGLTEFAGVQTITALAIGPNLSANIDTVTGKLRLY